MVAAWVGRRVVAAWLGCGGREVVASWLGRRVVTAWLGCRGRGWLLPR